MSKVVRYIMISYDEIVRKVTWPTTAQLQASAVVVLIASLIFALIIGGVDAAFKRFMQWMYQAF